MPPAGSLLAFALTATVIILVPGPSVLFVVGRSLAHGRRAGLLSVVGNELGALPLVLAVALGVGAVVAESVALFTAVKLAGAAYLALLGWRALRDRYDAEPLTVTGPERSGWVTVRQGFVVGVTNPKTTVFFVAVLPQFVDVHAGAVAGQLMVLGVLFALIALVCDGTWALVAGTARQWFASSPRRLARVRGCGGAMMMGLGGVLLLTGRPSS